MTLTIESVVAELEPLGPDATMAEICQAVAHGSLMGARGNSGVILSQLLRGLVERFKAVAEISPSLLVESLVHADLMARQAVVRPIEGTILSIARAGAQGAGLDDSSLTSTVRGARERAREALAFTPEQLPVLKQAGVVDAGGAGLVLFFDSLCSVVAHDPLPEAPPLESIVLNEYEPSAAHGPGDVANLRYEVMYCSTPTTTRCARFARSGPASATRS